MTPLPAPATAGALRLRLSWLAAGAGALLGLLVSGDALANARSATGATYLLLAGPLGMAYVAWAVFWGTPVSWRWFWSRRAIFAGIRRTRYVGLLYFLALSLAWVVWGVLVFSALGGGIYQFIRYRRRPT